MIQRKWNWPEILAEEIKLARSRDFQYGSHDCSMCASGLLESYTGVDIAKPLRGYTTARGSMRTLKQKGKGTLLRTMNWIMALHDCESVSNPKLLRRGDVCIAKVLVHGGGKKKEFAVGICVGGEAAFASDGLVFLPLSEIKKGWHCG